MDPAGSLAGGGRFGRVPRGLRHTAGANGFRLGPRRVRPQARRLRESSRRRRRPARAEGRRQLPDRASLRGRRPPVRAARLRGRLFRDRDRILVRRCLPRPPHRQRRGVRQGIDLGRAPDLAPAELRPGHQSRQRPLDDRARQRPRSLPRRSSHGRVPARGRLARLPPGRDRPHQSGLCGQGWTCGRRRGKTGLHAAHGRSARPVGRLRGHLGGGRRGPGRPAVTRRHHAIEGRAGRPTRGNG